MIASITFTADQSERTDDRIADTVSTTFRSLAALAFSFPAAASHGTTMVSAFSCGGVN